MSSQNDFLFSNEPKKDKVIYEKSWKILIVDDEPSIHDVTVLALDGFEFEGRNIEFFHAYNAKEAIALLKKEEDIALALVDVVMETEHAGLDLVDSIRNDLNNSIIRVVLRTGQPGQAPERSVIKKYDINDYKEKTELTSQKLYSVVYTSLRSYRDMCALEDNRKGLERVIKASSEIYKVQKLSELINGILDQLIAVLYLEKDTVYVNFDSLAIEGVSGEANILAGTGKFSDISGKDPFSELDSEIIDLLKTSIDKKSFVSKGNKYAVYFSPGGTVDDVLIFSSHQKLSDDSIHLLELFCNNLGIAYKNLLLHKEVDDTQREILYLLGEAVETRSKETGSHVRRVAEYSKLLAKLIGQPESVIELIELASPLHDFGKIGVPDRVLHKPGKLDDEEWEIMQSHASLGETMLSRSDRSIMNTASIIAGQHHEKWNGTGYPNGFKGEGIHIYARITALADVFDALGSKRCYKDSWPLDKVIAFIKEESGEHFDPNLVEVMCDNIDSFEEIMKKYPD